MRYDTRRVDVHDVGWDGTVRVILQRVSEARVRVAGQTIGEIGLGWLVLVGIAPSDTPKELRWMADKIAQLRCFPDDDGKMNRSVLDVGGAVLAVSNFTLYADAQKGRRPSFLGAARPEVAAPLFEQFLNELRLFGLPVQCGVFGAEMDVELVNHGPITIPLDSPTA
jgi:D-aminoacyl-tRNA deacylase